MTRQRLLTAASLLLVVPAGFAAKYATGPGWIADHGAGALYVVFWILAACLVWPSRRARIVAIVLGATCGLEFLQLWHPAPLEAVRATFIGRALIGTTFDWGDFPPYFLGAAAGWLWSRALEAIAR